MFEFLTAKCADCFSEAEKGETTERGGVVQMEVNFFFFFCFTKKNIYIYIYYFGIFAELGFRKFVTLEGA